MRKKSLSLRNSNIEKIRGFFDQDSLKRDEEFSLDRILGYEQEVRQQAISSLIGGSYLMVLDAGCGNGRDFSMLLQHAQTIIGIDFSWRMVAEAKTKADKSLSNQRIHLTTGDVTRLPFRDNSFDLIVCSGVLEHVPNWLEALGKFNHVLKPNGDLIIETPNKVSMYGLTRYTGRLILGSKHPYDKWKSYFELRNALKAAGFRVTAARGVCYLPGDISYYQPFKNIIIHLLSFARLLEKTLSDRWPFNLLGYGIVVRGKKIARA